MHVPHNAHTLLGLSNHNFLFKINFDLFIIFLIFISSVLRFLSSTTCMVRQDGKTALMWASDHGDTDVVELLLEAGANKTIQDKVGSIFK